MSHEKKFINYARSLVENYYSNDFVDTSFHWIKTNYSAPDVLNKMSDHEKDKLLALYIEYKNRDIGYDAFAETMDKLIVMLLDNNSENKKNYADSIRNEFQEEHMPYIQEIIEELCDDQRNILFETEQSILLDTDED